MPSPELDLERLNRALQLAERAIGVSDPNPRVGCVIGRADGSVLGEGSTQVVGGPHAEIMALRAAAASGADVRGATAWVSLEPCAHHGRTPPCCDALIDAGIEHVVAAIGDPAPHVNGAGFARLRAAGLTVALGDAAVAAAAFELNIGFFSRILRAKPWVRVKVAASLDGRTALSNGVSQWITGAESREDVQHWRNRASMVLTGIGTVLADDPRLDVRLPQARRQPHRAIVDSRLRTPTTARMLDAPGSVHIFTTSAGEERRTQLMDRGVDIHVLRTADGCVDIDSLMSTVGALETGELHVEAGAALTGALLRAGVVDELLLYQAPLLLGEGQPIARLGPFSDLSQAIRLDVHEVRPFGADLRLRLRPRGGWTFTN